jgi:hypothetical protein
MSTRSLEEVARAVDRTRRRALDHALERTHTALLSAPAALDDARRLVDLLALEDGTIDAPSPDDDAPRVPGDR